MAHTSGPWEVVLVDDGMTNSVTFIVRMGSHLGGANCWEPQHRIDYESSSKEASPEQFAEAEANARLIAAAPDLLAALKALSRYTDLACAKGRPIEYGSEYHALAEAASAALVKAQGT